ncbi:hypothetical protein GCM10009414_31000 [Tatumella terrea]
MINPGCWSVGGDCRDSVTDVQPGVYLIGLSGVGFLSPADPPAGIKTTPPAAGDRDRIAAPVG